MVRLGKQRFCRHGRPPKISITNTGGILHHSAQGWIQHDLVGGGGCSASSGAELCRSCVPPAHQLASLLQSLA